MVCISNFHSIAAPLSDVLENAHKIAGKREKNAVKKEALSKSSLHPPPEGAFRELQEILQNAVKQAYPEEKYMIADLQGRQKPLGLGSSRSQRWKKIQKQSATRSTKFLLL